MDENTANRNWIEAAWDSFEEALTNEDWKTAHAVIADTRSQYSDDEGQKMSKRLWTVQTEISKEEEYQDALEKNSVWLSEQGRTEGDVMQDDLGNSYILAETETGLERRYLPFANAIDFNF